MTSIRGVDHALGHRHRSGAALGPQLVKPDRPGADAAVSGDIRSAHGSGKHAVFKDRPPDGDRTAKMGILLFKHLSGHLFYRVWFVPAEVYVYRRRPKHTPRREQEKRTKRFSASLWRFLRGREPLPLPGSQDPSRYGSYGTKRRTPWQTPRPPAPPCP